MDIKKKLDEREDIILSCDSGREALKRLEPLIQTDIEELRDLKVVYDETWMMLDSLDDTMVTDKDCWQVMLFDWVRSTLETMFPDDDDIGDYDE